MSVGPAHTVPSPTETQVEPGGVRANAPVSPASDQDSYGKPTDTRTAPPAASDPHDEVKVQFESPSEIAVYEFVSSDGRLIVQVPSDQMLGIAREISQALAQESATPKPAGIEEGKANGH